jgi:hypothetical protein
LESLWVNKIKSNKIKFGILIRFCLVVISCLFGLEE